LVGTSIIVLTFNRKNLLKETLDSILAQTCRDFELIVVDNCSTDGTESLVKSCSDGRIRYFANQNNGIISVNLNYGISQARGEYIAICDDDDLWLPTKLEKQVEILKTHPEIDIVSTNCINFDEKGEHRVFVTKKRKSPYLSQAEILIRNIIAQSAVLFRKSALDGISGPFSISKDYFTCEDFEFWLRFLSNKKAYFIEEVLVKYRTHGGVYRTIGIPNLMISKKIVDDLRKQKYVSNKNYALFLARYYFVYFALLTGLYSLKSKLLYLSPV